MNFNLLFVRSVSLLPVAILLVSIPGFAKSEPDGADISVINKQIGEVQKANTAPCPECEAMKKEDGLCKHLDRFACAPGEYADGTGTGSTSDIIRNRVIDTARKHADEFQKTFEKLLQDPGNEYLKKLALSSLGLTYSPDCKDAASANCVKQLASGLSTMAMKRILPADTPTPNMPGLGGIGGGLGFGAMPALNDLGLLTSNAAYVKTEEALAKKIREAVSDGKTAQKIEKKIFPAVKQLIIERLQTGVANADTRKQLVDKINGITFQGTDCSEMTAGGFPQGGTNNVQIASLLIPNAFYDPMSNTFKYCNGFLLQNTSEFQIVDVIAHELSHSIDPCNIAKGPSDFKFSYSEPMNFKKSESEFPFPGLIKCLRGQDSVGAISMMQLQAATAEDNGDDQSPPDSPKKKKKQPESGGLGGLGGGGGLPGMPGMPGMEMAIDSAFCMGDQIGETFSDWMASEVLPEYMSKNYGSLSTDQFRYGYANATRGFCNNTSPPNPWGMMGFDVHPEHEKRVNAVILVNPKIRSQMGCKSMIHPKYRYCTGTDAGEKK